MSMFLHIMCVAITHNHSRSGSCVDNIAEYDVLDAESQDINAAHQIGEESSSDNMELNSFHGEGIEHEYNDDDDVNISDDGNAPHHQRDNIDDVSGHEGDENLCDRENERDGAFGGDSDNSDEYDVSNDEAYSDVSNDASEDDDQSNHDEVSHYAHNNGF